MKPHAINRMTPFLLLALFAALIAPLLPGGQARAQQGADGDAYAYGNGNTGAGSPG